MDATAVWDTAASAPLEAGTVTLVEGPSFCISLPSGDMLAGHPDAAKASESLSAFIRNLNGLHLKVTAAGPNGIVLTDLAAAKDNPAAFAQKLRFEVEGK